MARGQQVAPVAAQAQHPKQPQQGLQQQGSSVKLELSKHLTEDEAFDPHKPTACSRFKLLLWFSAAALVVGAVVGLSVTMVLVEHNRGSSKPPAPPAPAASPPAPPGGGGGGGGPGGDGSGDGGSTGGGTGDPIDPPELPPFTMPAGWTALWWDEFGGSSLDTSKWGYDIGVGNWGWGNNESQVYTNLAANVNQKGGQLNIVALRDKAGGWTSGRINTLGKASFYPGMTTKDGTVYSTIHIEASIQVPGAGQGLWPAFWMFPVDLTYGPWPASGEIDIMECINDMATAAAPHCVRLAALQDFKRYVPPNGKPFPSTLHTFAIDWTSSSITLSIDGKAMKTVVAANTGTGQAPAAGWWTVATGTPKSAPFDKPFYIILNLAVGGLWPGYPNAATPSPSTMLVDYVRVLAKSEGLQRAGWAEFGDLNLASVRTSVNATAIGRMGGAHRGLGRAAAGEAGGGSNSPSSGSWSSQRSFNHINKIAQAAALVKARRSQERQRRRAAQEQHAPPPCSALDLSSGRGSLQEQGTPLSALDHSSRPESSSGVCSTAYVSAISSAGSPRLSAGALREHERTTSWGGRGFRGGREAGAAAVAGWSPGSSGAASDRGEADGADEWGQARAPRTPASPARRPSAAERLRLASSSALYQPACEGQSVGRAAVLEGSPRRGNLGSAYHHHSAAELEDAWQRAAQEEEAELGSHHAASLR
eukprot:scaffold9.g3145.t1